MTLSLRTRIILLTLPWLLSLLIVSILGTLLLDHLGNSIKSILKENYDSVKAMVGVQQIAVKLDQLFLHNSSETQPISSNTFQQLLQDYQNYLKTEEENITIFPEEPSFVQQLHQLSIDYFEQAKKFSETQDQQLRYQIYFAKEADKGLKYIFQQIVEVSQQILELNEKQMRRESIDAQSTTAKARTILLLIFGIAVVLGLVEIYWLQKTILKPISVTTEAAKAIGMGHLELSVPILSKDEIGHLGESFNRMASKLRSYRQSNTEKLLRAQQTSQATIDSFTDPVVVVDMLGQIEIANPAAQKLLGLDNKDKSAEELCATGETTVPRPWLGPDILKRIIEEVLKTQTAIFSQNYDQGITFRFQEEDHVYLPQVSPIRSRDGEALGAAIVLNDITRFRILDRLKSDWVATVSHELKTPLTSVRLAVHVLLEEVVGPLEPKQLELLMEARENTERLFKLIDNLLALAQLEPGTQLNLEFKEQSIVPILQQCWEQIIPRAQDKHVLLDLKIDEDLPAVLLEPGRWAQAINNLLDNALNNTDGGGKISLLAQHDHSQQKLIVQIKDTGIGIPEESIPHLFEKFYRVQDSSHPQRREQYSGTGLGLAIVHDIVLAHHGRITCQSGVDQGTCFTIYLPVVQAGS